MSNHDLTIANGPGINVRQDIEAALGALGSNFQGSAAPLIAYPCQIWADSGTSLLKIRNVANTAWITIGPLDTPNFGHLPLAGGTITGNLTVNGNLVVGNAFYAAGGTIQATPGNWASFALQVQGSGLGRQLSGYTGANARWAMQLGDSAAESSGNAGSNFAIQRFNDAGAYIDTPLSINRAGGGVTVGGNLFVTTNLTVNVGTLTGNAVNCTSVGVTVPSGSTANLNLAVTGVRNWQLFTNTDGTFYIWDVTAGRSFIQIAGATGAVITPFGFQINGGSGQYAMYAASNNLRSYQWGCNGLDGTWYLFDSSAGAARLKIDTAGRVDLGMSSPGGYGLKVGGQGIQYASYGTLHSIAYSWTAPLTVWIDNNNVGTLTPVTSDIRLKANVAPAVADALAELNQLELISYDLPDRVRPEQPAKHFAMGFSAQQMEPIIPEAVLHTSPLVADPERDLEANPYADEELLRSLDLSPLLARCVGAIQQLTARIETLEGLTR